MLEPLAPWYAASPESEWEFETDEDRASFDERWDPIVGDRQTEIVFIGVDMDEAAIRARLDSCVVTGREFEKGPKKGRILEIRYLSGIFLANLITDWALPDTHQLVESSVARASSSGPRLRLTGV